MLFNCNAYYDVVPDKMAILKNKRTPDISDRREYYGLVRLVGRKHGSWRNLTVYGWFLS